MATFNQQGQQVNNQFNAAGDIHIGNMQHHSDLLPLVQQLVDQLDQGMNTGQIPADAGMAAKQELEQAATNAREAGKDKSILVKHLTKAGEILKGISAAGSIADSIKQLVKAVSNWFL